MNKIDTDYMINSFNQVSQTYKEAAENVGLWNSEKDLVEQYTSNHNDKILDMGCGAGRCAIGIEKLGYKDICAIDFSPNMIVDAKSINSESMISFEVGDCTCIEKEDDTFDFIIFSFNGLMQIPKYENRLQALKELNRVLKSEKYLVFTTHDRNNGDDKYRNLWLQEEEEWNAGVRDLRLHDFGDVITFDDDNNVEYFIHIPSYKEIEKMIKDSSFELVDSFIRSKRYRESKEVYDFSDNCRFWVVKKL